jgi:hypothetical protein
MTQRKHFKQLVRSRMTKTGESYTSARRQILHEAVPASDRPLHLPGSIPAATALRIILANAGVRAPHTGRPYAEPMLFGLAGGVGIGIFSFLYEKEDFASFFIAGRHLWHDDLAYLSGALARLKITPAIRESSSPKASEKSLRELLEIGPTIAWVDMAQLPHRAMPAEYSGGGYHVLTIYELRPDGTALVGDLTDEPVEVPGPILAEARARIKKYKNRVLAIPVSTNPPDLAVLIREGLRACHRGLLGEGSPANARANFSLEALGRWADRLHGHAGKDGWEYMFTPGKRLYRGLVSITQFVEHWGTGGGLSRPLMAEFLNEAGEALADSRLETLAAEYAGLGRAWTSLADAALPAGVPEFREARDLHARISELTNSGGPPREIQSLWQSLATLEAEIAGSFPLSDSQCAALRCDLQERVRALHASEVAAHAALGEIIATPN